MHRNTITVVDHGEGTSRMHSMCEFMIPHLHQVTAESSQVHASAEVFRKHALLVVELKGEGGREVRNGDNARI